MMISNRSMPEAVIVPELAYGDVNAAADWLCAVFGFAVRLRIGNHRVQLTYGPGSLVVTQLPAGETEGPEPAGSGPSAHALMVRVDDVQRHYAHVMQHGAEIIHPPADYPYGERQYTVKDPGGHIWTFSETIADVDPQSWGGFLPESP